MKVFKRYLIIFLIILLLTGCSANSSRDTVYSTDTTNHSMSYEPTIPSETTTSETTITSTTTSNTTTSNTTTSNMTTSITTASGTTTSSTTASSTQNIPETTESTKYSDDTEITFTDAILEAIIRDLIGKKDGAIRVRDVVNVFEINAIKKEIRSIEGLQYFRNLRGVNLMYNMIEDISPLAELTQLNWANLNQISNVEFDVSIFSSHQNFTLYCNNRIYEFNGDEPLTPAFPAPVLLIYSAEGKNVDYLILLDNETLLESIDEFYSFKTSQGFQVCVELVGNIPVKNKNRTDDIREYLHEMDWINDLEYVLLIGAPYNAFTLVTDNTGGNIPMKYLYVCDDESRITYDGTSVVYVPDRNYWTGSSNFPTDLYYVFDIDWNKDKDEFAGERNCDFSQSDIYNKKPLFALGRIPFSDKESVQFILANSISAQEKYINKTELTRTALIAAPMLGFVETGLSTRINNLYYLDTSRDGEVIRSNLEKAGVQATTLYEKEGITQSPFECTLPLNRQNFMNEFTKGYDMVFSKGHGGVIREIFRTDHNNNGFYDPDDVIEKIEYWDSSRLQNAMNTFTFMDA